AITAYHLRYRTGGGAWTEISSGIGTSTHHTITGLMNSTTYDVQARAVNAQGAGNWSESSTETPIGVSFAPNEFMLAVSLQTITATWTAPGDTGDSDITHYELQHHEVGAAEWEPAVATADADTLTLIITGLTNGTEYEVRVYAVNAIGTGNPATDTATTPIGPPSMPNAPRLTVGDTQLTATWTAPNDGGSAITSYDVQYSSDSGTNWTLVADPIAGTAASYTITGLTNDGTSYDVQVRAKNAVLEDAGNGAGIGDWSASATRRLLPLATQVPKVPSGGTAASVILSAAIDDAIANAENPSVTVAGVTSGTSVTPPTVDSSTGVITVTAGTTAGIYVIYVIYGETESGDKLLVEYFSVTLSPTTNAELKTAVTAGINNWGNTAVLNYIITTAVTDMSGIFGYKGAFNGDISLWDTAAVTNMSGMFIVARTFNGDISNWDVSKVINMAYMFSDANAFNGDISSNWDVSKVTNMSLMFGGATSFNRDISGWGDVSKVTDMSKMFKNARSFNQDISGWTIAATPNMTEMFDGASAFSQNLEAWGDHLTLNASNIYEGSKANMFRNSDVGTGKTTAYPSWYAE
ncbi:MAG: BspA family leucine-rich repeat surface protein, partial [Salinispira sp.]